MITYRNVIRTVEYQIVFCNHRSKFSVIKQCIDWRNRDMWVDPRHGVTGGFYLRLPDRSITVPDPKVQLAVGTLQSVIDQDLKDNGGEVDYIHGDDVTRELGSKPGNMGFLLPAMGKEQLFKTVMADGVLPRKTFSLGHAQDKRYYIEARKIVK